MKLPLDVMLNVVDIVSREAIRHNDLRVFLTLAKVSRVFKHVMYNKSIRRMFLAAHASKAKRYNTWAKVGPRMNQLLSNPLVYFDDDLIVKLCKEFSCKKGNKKYDFKAMKRFFGHRGVVQPYGTKNKIDFIECTGWTAFFSTELARKWVFKSHTITMVDKPLCSGGGRIHHSDGYFLDVVSNKVVTPLQDALDALDALLGL